MCRNILCCKGCQHLCDGYSVDPKAKRCKLDHKFKAATKSDELWIQYSTVCPLKKYCGKGNIGDNPIVYTEAL